MGKGDKKTFRGKLMKGSFGKSRNRKEIKRKRLRKNMKTRTIICDTNIYYCLGDGTIKLSQISSKSRLCVSQVNLQEFTYTANLLHNESLVRNAIQASFKYHQVERFDPPLIYIKQLSDKEYKYDLMKDQGQFLEFTSKIAKGYSIDENKKKEFENVCKKKKSDFEKACVFFNNEADKISKTIKSTKKHRSADTIELNRNLIDLFVKSITKDNGLSTTFKWKQIELFEYVLKEFLFDLETGAKKVVPNDWNDLFQMLYVQPKEKYWTKDKYWVELIKKAGMQKYLYEES
jgi:ribosomal small subunit protein bTHX